METPSDGASTEITEDLAAQDPKPVAWSAVDSPERPPEVKTPGRRPLWRRVLGSPARYPRVTVEFVLMVTSLVVAFYFLPTTAAAKPGGTAPVMQVAVERPASVPTYVGDLVSAGSSDEVLIGMDVPAGSQPVNYSLQIEYSDSDHMVDRQVAQGDATFGAVDPATDKGYQVMVVTGTFPAGDSSYSELKNGFSSEVSQLQVSSSGSGEPKGVVDLSFTLQGPVQATEVEGATMAANLPTVGAFSSDATANDTPGPLVSELVYNGGNYQNQTGGPTIQQGSLWDWMNQGDQTSVSATGVDPAAQQIDNNNFFIAAVLFGLAAAAAAALAVELVEAIQDHRREKRAALAEAASNAGTA